jgi:hypothetical protein
LHHPVETRLFRGVFEAEIKGQAMDVIFDYAIAGIEAGKVEMRLSPASVRSL